MKSSISTLLKIKTITSSESMNEAHFFNSSYFLRQKPFETKGWQLIKEKPIAQLFFFIHNKEAISGYKSTFGSIDLAENILFDDLCWFVNSLLILLKKEGIKKITIQHFPSYMKNSGMIEKVFERCGFTILLQEVNQHITIQKVTFEEVANRSEVIRSNKCDQRGYRFKIATLDELPEIYKLIEQTLLRKGNTPSMSYLNLRNIIAACPNIYILFTLWDDKKLIAAAVSIKINKRILYNFYHADHFEYRSISAITYLLKNIYLYCLWHKFSVLDLGISSLNGKVNKGLFFFKKMRGAQSSAKIKYQIKL